MHLKNTFMYYIYHDFFSCFHNYVSVLKMLDMCYFLIFGHNYTLFYHSFFQLLDGFGVELKVIFFSTLLD